LKFPRDPIGVDDDRATFGQQGRDCRFSRPDAAGETDEDHADDRCLLGGLLGRRAAIGFGGAFLAVLLVVVSPSGFALGVIATDPVAVLVDLEVAAVFLGQFTALCGLLDRQADAATVEVEIDDLDPQFFTRGETCSGVSTWCADISEMWTRPSMPSPT